MKDSEEAKKLPYGRIVVFIAIVAGVGYFLSGGGSPHSQTSAAAPAAPTVSAPSAALPGIGQPASDGKFQFTVQSVKCGLAQVGPAGAVQTAQGQYCVLDLTVQNIGNQSQMFDATAQYLYNAAGQKYSASTTATLYAAPPGCSFDQSINPGNTASGCTVVFDIPKGAVPTVAELHDSMFSGGVRVRL